MNAVIATAMARRLMASVLAKTRYAAERKEAEQPTNRPVCSAPFRRTRCT